MNGTVSYILSRKYTELTAVGLGAVKGKPAVLEKVESVEGGQALTFKWTGDDGTVQRRTITISDGVGIKDIKIENEHLIFYLSDGNIIDAGEISGSGVASGIWIGETEPPKDKGYVLWIDPRYDKSEPVGRTLLGEELVASTNIGSVTSGKTYPVGTDIEAIIRDILISYLKPIVTIGINPTTTLYNIEEDTISSLTISANVTKRSSEINKVRFYIDDKLVETVVDGVKDGGVIKHTVTFDPPINETFIAKVDAVDKENQVVSSQTTISFVSPSYYGYLPENTLFSVDEIKNLSNKELKTKKELTYKGITTPGTASYYITYCYPADLGNITSVKDDMNFEYIQDYTIKPIKINDVDYVLMYQTDPGSVEDYTQKFT